MIGTRRRTIAAAAALLATAGLARAQTPPMPLARIAFGSCAHQDVPQPIWDAVLAYRPDLFVFGGDNIYGDASTADVAGLRRAYAKQRGVEGFARIRAATRIEAIWDDHDFGVNDGGADAPFKQQAKDAFLEFWDIPADDPRRARPGLYHARTYGPAGQRVQVILLDTRWFRSPLRPTDQRGAPGKERWVPDDDPAKTMLGPEQWAWLRERLLEPAELRLVVSGIQVVADGHGWERWGNLPRERQRLYDLVAETRAGGVIFLSGDRHLGAIYRETAAAPYPMVDITGSSINRPFPSAQEAGPNRLGEVYGFVNFGTLDIDWWERSVTLAVRDEVGQPRRRLVVPFAELQPR